MRVTLVKRWKNHPAGAALEVTDSIRDELVLGGFVAESVAEKVPESEDYKTRIDGFTSPRARRGGRAHRMMLAERPEETADEAKQSPTED